MKSWGVLLYRMRKKLKRNVVGAVAVMQVLLVEEVLLTAINSTPTEPDALIAAATTTTIMTQ